MNMIITCLKLFLRQTFFFITLTKPKITNRLQTAGRMNKTLIYISLFLIINCFSVNAQEFIQADKRAGCDTLKVTFTLQNALDLNDYTNVEWNFGDGQKASGALVVSHFYQVPGIYTVRCVLDGARVVEEKKMISLSPTPYADFTFKDTSQTTSEFRYLFESKYFRAIDGIKLSYLWRFPDGTEMNDSITEYTFSNKGIYKVFFKISDSNSCADSIVKEVPISDSLLIPNVFSPNGDDQNDYFSVATSGEENWQFRIFTRSGMQVYYSNAPTIFWDGRLIDGRYAPEGVYFYVIDMEGTKSIRYKGYVYLFREHK